jgi:hypothetical protein
MDDLEEQLRRYRPAGPPADLRARVVESARVAGAGGLREWLPAVAAALVAMLFYWMAANEGQRLAGYVSPAAQDEVMSLPTELTR